MDCVFCNIASGKNRSDIVYQDENISAFPDIHPQAPTHILIIPKTHIQSLNSLADKELSMVTEMIKVARKIADDKGLLDRGYRIVINTGKEGGQIIQHLHMHLLGGRQLKG